MGCIMACKNEKTALEKAAEEPKAVTGDQGSWTNHSLSDQIKLDQYNAEKAAAPKLPATIYRARYHPPSALGR